jgi:hypothetical protein
LGIVWFKKDLLARIKELKISELQDFFVGLKPEFGTNMMSWDMKF